MKETQAQRLIADYVLCCDDDFTVHSPGAIDIDGDTITWVGPVADAPEAPAGSTSTKLPGLLMPGLVNTHCHTPMTLMRGAGDGLALKAWLEDVMWPRERVATAEDNTWGMALGAAEMLLSGTTTSCEMYLHEEAVVAGARQAGTRLVITPGIVPELEDPADPANPSSLSARLDQITAYHQAMHNPAGLVTVGIAPHSPEGLGVANCAAISARARELDALMHIHIAETSTGAAALEAEHQASVVQILADHGVFEARTLSAHSVWLDDADLDTFARYDVAVAHCPVSNMKLGSGVARIADMLARGIRVTLGTDGPASNDTLDLWEEVKLTPMLARIAELYHNRAADSPAAALANSAANPPPTSEQILKMVTSDGAQALGLDRVGSLAAGNFADIIHISTDTPSFTPIYELDDLVSHLVWSAGSRDVLNVWVAGEQVVAGGECLTVDVEQARHEVQRRAVRIASEAEA